MLNIIKKIFSAPTFQDDQDKNLAAELVHTVLITLTIVGVLGYVGALLGGNAPRLVYIIVSVFSLLMLALQIPLRLGYVKQVSAFIILSLTLLVTSIMFSTGTVRIPSIVLYVLASIIAGLTISRQAAYWSMTINIALVFGLIYAEINHLLPPAINETTITQAVSFTLFSFLTIILINQALKRIQNLLKLAKSRENDLATLNQSLEQRIIERTKALTASAEVSRRVSTILEPTRLVYEVVEQIKNTFGYYHAHIYLKNEITDELIMAGGTGDVGKTLLARGHKISKGKGLVGRAAESNELILVSDTTADPNWLPNELLPDTKSEIAVPISLGSEVLGVLDVQQNNVNGLTQADAELLQTVSYQVAVALRNAQTYTQTQQVAERESLINEISRKIQNTATVEQALQVTVRELGTALGAKDSRVVLSLPENK
jgi:GAF domain-containing protein